MPDYSNSPELAYDWMIVVYFFLGGLSAGTFLFSIATTYWKEELRPLGKRPAILAPIILAAGLFILLIDLGQPFRAWRLMLSFNPSSALSWGVWFLNIFFALSVLYAWNLHKTGPDKARTFGYIGVPFAVLVAAYTGVLLFQAPARVLWHSPLIPILFVNGAVVSGIALGLLVEDPVVASDSIKRTLAEGRSRLVASWLGPTRLAEAIFFATVTNIVAYLPLLMLTGNQGDFLQSLPIVMTCCTVSGSSRATSRANTPPRLQPIRCSLRP